MTVSSRKEPVDKPVDKPVDEDAWNQPPDGEEWPEDTTDEEMEDVVDATAAASTEAPRRPKSLEQDRAEARRRVLLEVRVLLASAEHQGLTQRAILNKALDSIDRAGGRFWGAGGVYSRRRTAVDAVLRAWVADGGLPAELSGM